MGNPLSISTGTNLPVCLPGDDPLAEPDPFAPPADAPPSCPVGKDSSRQFPPPDHPAAKPSAPPPLPDDEQTMLDLWGPATLKSYQETKARKLEVQQAQRSFLDTGKIPQTKTPFAWIEILQGKLMTRAERYDAMLRAQGKTIAVLDDVQSDERDPVYLSKEEFKQEFWAREKTEWKQCEEEYTRPGKIDKCKREVNEKYGGESFKAWRDDREARTGVMVRAVAERIEGVANGGGLATAGRAVGGLLGWATGHDTLTWSEYGAAVGGLGDAAAPIAAPKIADARAKAAPSPAPDTDRIGAKPIEEGYGKGGTRLSPTWSNRERGLGTKDCVAATCARSLREGEVTNAKEVLGRAGWSPRTVHEMKGLDMGQARDLFKANGKVLADPVRGLPTEKGDYAVVVYQDGRPKHMVYMRVLGPRPGDLPGMPRGFYIDDAQMGVRLQGDAARAYLQQRHDIMPIQDEK